MIGFDKFKELYLERRLENNNFKDCALMAHTYILLSDDGGETNKAIDFIKDMEAKQ